MPQPTTAAGLPSSSSPLDIIHDEEAEDISTGVDTDRTVGSETPIPISKETEAGVLEAGLQPAVSSARSESYPEGGLQAWLVVLGSWLGLISAMGLLNTLATFQSYLMTNQLSDYDEGTVGWIFSVYVFMLYLCGLYIGPLFDKYGPRWLFFAGNITIAGSLMLFSISTQLWHFILSFGVLSGIGCSLLFTPGFTAPGHFFLKHRGLATGLATTGGSIGGIVFPLLLESLFPRLGWGWSIRILGFLCLALGAAGNLLIRSRLPPDADAQSKPDFRIFRGNRAFLLATAGVFLLELAMFIPLTYLSSYARSVGFSTRFAFQILPVMNAASFFGRVLPGHWADKVGSFNINIAMTLLSAVACLAVWLPGGATAPGLVVFAILFGFASGCNISITPVCIGALCRTQQYGRYYATCYTIVSFACLVGVPIGGNIVIADEGSYWGVIVFTGLVNVGSVLFFGAAKVSAVGWKPTAIF